MAIAKIYQQGSLTLYAADTDTVFEPYPFKDTLPDALQTETFTLKAGQSGQTPFQIIVFSDKDRIITGLESDGVTCLVLEGMDINGKPFQKSMKLEAGKPWPLWCLMSKPTPGKHDFILHLDEKEDIVFSLMLDVSELNNHLLEDKDSLARIAWLNSDEGNEDVVTKWYPPIEFEGNIIHLLGHDITLSSEGFIQSIQTHFCGNNSKLSDVGREMLAKPLQYKVFEEKKEITWTPCGLEIHKDSETTCRWRAVNTGDGITLTVDGTLEFDGSVKLCARIKNAAGRCLSVRLCYEPLPAFSRYFMGLGKQGGATPDTYHWKWDENKHQNSIWCGSVNGGIFIHPTVEDVKRPFVNVYFRHSRHYMPQNWVIDGKGYFSLNRQKGEFFFDSGEWIADENNYFCSDILIIEPEEILLLISSKNFLPVESTDQKARYLFSPEELV